MKVKYSIQILERFSNTFNTFYLREDIYKGKNLVKVSSNECIQGYVGDRRDVSYEESTLLVLEELKEDFDVIINQREVRFKSESGISIVANFSNGIETIEYKHIDFNIKGRKYRLRIIATSK